MNRIISEELTKEFALLLSHQLIQCEAPDRPFYQKMFDELRSAPVASGVDLVQEIDAFLHDENVDYMDWQTSNRGVGSRAEQREIAENLAKRITLPPQPVEPVARQVVLDVSVAMAEYQKTLSPDHSQLGCFCDGFHWALNLTALQHPQPKAVSGEVVDALEEINEARMTILDSMEKQSTVKVVVQYLDNAVALLTSRQEGR